MKASLKELCDQNPTLNTDDLTLEKALLPNFDSLVSCSYLSTYLKVVFKSLQSTFRGYFK